MNAQEKTEQVLRKIHVLFSKAEPFENSKRRVIVDKTQMMNLLKELNECMYDMLEEHELTEAGRDKAKRRTQRENDEIIFESRKNAEEIYAASLMYSDRSLSEISDVIREAQKRIDAVHEEFDEKLKTELATIKSNQFELKGQLQGLIDTQKYLKLIEEENARRLKEKEKEKKDGVVETNRSPTSDVAVEIKVNEAYFREQGYEDLLDEKDSEEEKKEEPEIHVDLDAEYFSWKEEEQKDKEGQAAEEKPKFSLFGFGKKT